MLIEGMGDIAREYYREAERSPRKAEGFERDIERDVLGPIRDRASDQEVSTDGLPTAAQIRETMGGVLRGVIYGALVNRNDIKDGMFDLKCDINHMAEGAIEGI
mgnify:CR=1 FL=1|tara:strand:+ start:581 stop:892 length:312 start_codon:yes stop_codon:yes gene_type:complete